MASPRVSVVIPTYNRAHLLPRAVGSVLAQTFEDWELIIVDDGSEDDTSDVIAGFGDARIRCIRHERNQGAGAARNTALAAARGEYIAPLDDDDEFLPDALMELATALGDSPPEVGIVYGFHDIYINQAAGQVRVSGHDIVMNGDMWEVALSRRIPFGSTPVMVRAESVRAVGGYDASVEFGEDTDLTVRLCAQGNQVRCVPKVLANTYESHDGYIRRGEDPRQAECVAAYMRAHVARYRACLDKRPSLYFVLAYDYLIWTGRSDLSKICLARAARACPTPANVYRSVKMLIWWTTPLSRFRNSAKRLRNRLFGDTTLRSLL